MPTVGPSSTQVPSKAPSEPTETPGGKEITSAPTPSPEGAVTPESNASNSPVESPVTSNPADDSSKPLQPTEKPKIVAPTGHDEVSGKNGFLIAITAFAASVLAWFTGHFFFSKGDRSN